MTAKIRPTQLAPEGSGMDRRAFLKTASLGVAASAGAAALGADRSGAAPAEAEAAEDGPRRGRARETEHVRRVYQLARF